MKAFTTPHENFISIFGRVSTTIFIRYTAWLKSNADEIAIRIPATVFKQLLQMAVDIVQHRAVVENALTVHRASQSSDRRGGIEPADGPRRALVATEGRLSLVRGDPEPLLV